MDTRLIDRVREIISQTLHGSLARRSFEVPANLLMPTARFIARVLKRSARWLDTRIGLVFKYVHMVPSWSIKPHAFHNFKQV